MILLVETVRSPRERDSTWDGCYTWDQGNSLVVVLDTGGSLLLISCR